MHKHVLAILAGILVISFGLTGTAEAAAPCVKDIMRLCKGVKPGQNRIIRCLWEKRAEISPECKAKAKRDWERAMQISADCASDTRKFCRGILPGHWRIVSCLWSHKDELSPPCKAHADEAVRKMEEAKKKIGEGLEKLVLGACKKDRDKHCADVKPGQGRVWNCLKEHMGELRPMCKAKIKRVEKRQGK